MFVRMSTIHGAQGKTDAAVEFVEEVGRPALESAAGSRGVAVFVDDESGRTVVASYWDTADAMRASESALASLRGQAAAVGGGDITIQSYEVAVARRLSVPVAGAIVRLLRVQGDPHTIDDMIAFYRAEALPVLVGLAGLCSVQLLIDRESGDLISATAWEDAATLAAAQGALAKVISRFGHRFGDWVTGVDSYTMVGTTVRMS